MLTSAPASAGDYPIALQDRDGRDTISGTIKLSIAHLGRDEQATVAATGLTKQPRLTQPEAFILTGFSFDNGAGIDRHVLQVKVEQFAGLGYIDVRFVDNSASGLYSAEVTYAVIPRSALNLFAIRARSAVPVVGESVEPRPSGVALLQSFDLRFLNGDHHLQRIGIDLTGGRIFVRFRDQDANDPFVWFVQYSTLR